jgi:hypothetical protein
MTFEVFQAWMARNPGLAPWALGGGVIILSLVVLVIARYFIVRGLTYLARRTESKYDDIVVEEVRPFRFSRGLRRC